MRPKPETRDVPAVAGGQLEAANEVGQESGLARNRWRVAGISIALAVIVFAVFGQTVHFGFVNMDDNDYVYENPVVSKGISLAGIEWAFTHAVSRHWHPLTVIVLMMEDQFFGLWPGGYHLVNVLLHAASVIFLFLMMREMTGALWRSAFVAAVFAIHPLRAESVAWISECKDVLSGMFFMLTLWAYVRYVRNASRGRYAMVLLWFVLGLMSKAMLITTPCVLVLLDYWPLGRLKSISQLPRLLWEKAPLFLLSALSGLAAVFAPQTGVERSPISSFPANVPIAYVFYLEKLVYPAGLAVPYLNPAGGWPGWFEFDALLLLAALTVGVWFLRRNHPYVLTGWLWYLGMLVPVNGLMQTGSQAYADRYTYLPLIGIYVGAAWMAADWAGERRYRRVAMGAISAVIVGVLAVAGWCQTTYWRDSVTLWNRALECTRDNYFAHADLGHALFDQGEPEEAIAQYREALRINPDYSIAHTDLGVALYRKGFTQEAAAQYREALGINPADVGAQTNLGLIFFQQGRTEEAVAQYRKALDINPAYVAAHTDLGIALFQQGHTEEAVAQYHEALEINPNTPETHANLGNALFQQGRTEEAVAEYDEALKINPAYAAAHTYLANALLQEGRIDEAIGQYRAALQFDPGDVTAQTNLGVTLFGQGRAGEAIPHFERVLELQPADVTAQNDLAWLLATARQSGLRNGARALELAAKASQESGGNDPAILRTLAAAYAETGEFSDALQTANKALQLAEAQSNGAVADALRREIKLYQAGRRLEDVQ